MEPQTANLDTDAASRYEQTIPVRQRLLNGQYYTPAPVCDLMLALTLQIIKPGKQLRLLEPACGAGAFLLRALDWGIRAAKLAPADCLKMLQGVELETEAVGLASEQLRQLMPGYSFKIMTADFISPVVEVLGQFDVIIGNPPYVRHEHLAQSERMDKKAALAYLTHQYAAYLQKYPEQKALFSSATDLYIWFYLQAATLLKPGGLLTFVTSNSWLNASYGQAFRKFITHHFDVLSIIESACERWFKDAAINPVILVLRKKETLTQKAEIDEATSVYLLRFLTPLAEWMPDPQKHNYWQRLHEKIQDLPQDTSVEMKTLSATGLTERPTFYNYWSFLLRAPLELMRFMENSVEWLRLDQLGKVRYPLKTGINRFFYMTRQQAQAREIAPEFLWPVIRSARQVKGYQLQEADCESVLFSCGDSLEALTAEALAAETLAADSQKKGALAYINWGAQQTSPPRQKRGQPIPWPQVPSVQSHQPWYYVKPLIPAHILCNRFIDQRFFFPICQGRLLEDQTFYGLTLFDPQSFPPALIAGLLNSTLSFLLVEFNGRTNLGEGVLQYARCDMAAFPVLNPMRYSDTEQADIITAFQRMAQRPILPLAEEMHSPDRVALDEAVLTPLLRRQAISEPVQCFRNRLVSYLLNRVRERILLARSSRKR